MTKSTGGFVYPSTTRDGMGMTLRDRLAESAMREFVGRGIAYGNQSYHQMAERSYSIADAMLKVSGKNDGV